MQSSSRQQPEVLQTKPDLQSQFSSLSVEQRERPRPQEYWSSDTMASQRIPREAGSSGSDPTRSMPPMSRPAGYDPRLPSLPSNPAQNRPRIQPVHIPPANIQPRQRPQASASQLDVPLVQSPQSQFSPRTPSPKPVRGILKAQTPVATPQRPPPPPSATGVSDTNPWGVAAAAASPSSPRGHHRLKGVIRFLRGASKDSDFNKSPASLEKSRTSPTKPQPVLAFPEVPYHSQPQQQPPPQPQLPPPPPPLVKSPRAAMRKLRFMEGVEVIPRPEIDSDPYDDEELEQMERPPSPRRGSMIWELGLQFDWETVDINALTGSPEITSPPAPLPSRAPAQTVQQRPQDANQAIKPQQQGARQPVVAQAQDSRQPQPRPVQDPRQPIPPQQRLPNDPRQAAATQPRYQDPQQVVAPQQHPQALRPAPQQRLAQDPRQAAVPQQRLPADPRQGNIIPQQRLPQDPRQGLATNLRYAAQQASQSQPQPQNVGRSLAA